VNRNIAHAAVLAASIVIIGTSAPAVECGGSSGQAIAVSAEGSALDVSGVTGLLDVLDAIAARHPDYAEESRRLEAMGEAERRVALEAKVAANASDDEINRLIDVLYATDAYRMYFIQFRNVSPEVHRRILLALPYQTISSPADISHKLRELWFNRGALRAWVDGAFREVDLGKCRDEAARWLPPGRYEAPPVYFVYDGNGGAFVRFGAVCFDLFGLVFRKRPPETRFDDLANLDIAQIEPVLAHEFHHVFARSIPRKQKQSGRGWQAQRRSELASLIVSEGVAMRCNLGEGLKRAAMEDTATVVYWIGQLNEKLAELEKGEISEEQWQQWLETTYQDLARERLRDFLAREYPGGDLEVLMSQHGAERPMMVYTLGWWMISRILEDPDGHERVVSLLSDPDRVFAEYNQSIGEEATAGLRLTGW
jgi:hypothetical protein